MITHLCFSDILGGANLSAWRLHHALVDGGFESRMLVRIKQGDDPRVRAFDTGARRPERTCRAWRRWQIRRSASRFRLNPDHPSASLTDPRSEWRYSLLRQLPKHGPLHLHWVNRFIDWTTFFRAMGRSGRPLIWTLRDMTPVTGGCSYDFGCGRFADKCGRCPQLANGYSADASNKFLRIKERALQNLPEQQLTIITLNRWMAGMVSRSPMFSRFRSEVIPNGVDCFGVEKKTMYVDSPEETSLRLIAAAVDTTDRRKNLQLLLDAIATLPDHLRLKVHLTLVGQGEPPADPPCEIAPTGYVADPQSLAQHYAAADLYVHPALEDNQPNTVLEAMAAGTPALVCDTGGVAEMIPTDHNWPMVVPRNDVESMTRALAWWIGNRHQAAAAGQQCRQHVIDNFSRRLQVERHVKLYESVDGGR